jgi:addiction module HigA family antidote
LATERHWPDLAVPPGEFLAETLEEIGMSQSTLARQTGRPVQAVNEIVRGKKEITPETALQLEQVLGVPAHVWTRLEADYQLTKARLAAKRSRRGTAAAGGDWISARFPSPSPRHALASSVKKLALEKRKEPAKKK